MLRLNVADLQISAGGDVRVFATVPVREISDARELPVREDAIRNAQAAHEAVLRGGDVEQAMKAPTEIVDTLWKLPSLSFGFLWRLYGGWLHRLLCFRPCRKLSNGRSETTGE